MNHNELDDQFKSILTEILKGGDMPLSDDGDNLYHAILAEGVRSVYMAEIISDILSGLAVISRSLIFPCLGYILGFTILISNSNNIGDVNDVHILLLITASIGLILGLGIHVISGYIQKYIDRKVKSDIYPVSVDLHIAILGHLNELQNNGGDSKTIRNVKSKMHQYDLATNIILTRLVSDKFKITMADVINNIKRKYHSD